MISWIKNISTYCYTITRLQGYKDRTVFDRSLFRSLLYSPRFVIAGTLSLDDEERANEERKKRYRIVWYRARNEFSNKRATALCPVQHDNGNLSPSIIASSLPISGTPISTAIGMFSIFFPRYLFFQFSHESPSYIAIIRRASIPWLRAIKPPRIILRKYFVRHGVSSIYRLVSVSLVIFQ